MGEEAAGGGATNVRWSHAPSFVHPMTHPPFPFPPLGKIIAGCSPIPALSPCLSRAARRLPMALIPLRTLLDHAAANNYGVAAFNVNNMEQIQSIMEAAKEIDAPVIVQASRGARSYSQDAYLRHLMLAAAELYPQIPIAMHQDHGNSPSTCKSAIEQNFTSVMMDGSLKDDAKTPADYDYNVKVTADVVKMAHPL